MRINIEASAEELAEIIANGMNIGDLPEAIIVAIDDCLSLPGYNVTVNEPSAIQAQLVAALESVFKIQIENYGDAISTHINLVALTTKVQDAIFVAGARP